MRGGTKHSSRVTVALHVFAVYILVKYKYIKFSSPGYLSSRVHKSHVVHWGVDVLNH